MNNFGRNLILWVIIAILLATLFNMFGGSEPQGNTGVKYSDFLSDLNAGQIESVVIQGERLDGVLRDGRSFSTNIPPNDTDLIRTLTQKGVQFESVPSDEGSPTFWGVVLSFAPMLLLIGVWIYFMRQSMGGAGRGGAMGFGKSRARLLTERQGKVTFEDVAGIDEAKEELQELVEFLRNPQKFQRLGGRIPKGALLTGPPGTGKTLLGRAIAGEANVPFFYISGSDFVEMFVGVGASRVRDMFEQAKKNAPCIIFIDEIDAVGRHRGAGLGGGNDEREQTLNQLLVEMDGFETNEGVIVIASTNRPDVLDPALLRPGRFDRQVVVTNPDILGREKILKVHMKKVPLASDVRTRVIARGTPGFTGADLENLVNEAALLAARKGKHLVTMQELEESKDKVMMGTERRSLVMTDDEKKLTAYHEGGHALVACHCPESDPIHKATIIPRGRALGMVMRLPERDNYSQSKAKLLDDITVGMGGRVAEEIIFGVDMITTGASGDFNMATKMAKAMVTQFGMSDVLGPQSYAQNEEEVFLGHSIARQQNVSEETARIIDLEVKKIIDSSYARAAKILNDNISDLHKIANALLEYESLSGEDIDAVIAGKALHRDEPEDGNDLAEAASTVPTSGHTQTEDPDDFGGMEPEPQPGT